MRPGDALYLRAGVPHRCLTSAAHSLHMSFDLVDSSPRTLDITKEANNIYAHACEEPYVPLSSVVERYVGILQSDRFQQALGEATQFKRQEIAQFRQMMGRADGVRCLKKFK